MIASLNRLASAAYNTKIKNRTVTWILTQNLLSNLTSAYGSCCQQVKTEETHEGAG
jgi:hypothetical protein